MIVAKFASTNNFFCKARYNARFGLSSIRRAFFMPICQFFDTLDKISSTACLKWYLNDSHFNSSLCGELFVGDEEGSRFFCLQLTNNLIMAQSNPTPTKHTVEVTTCQLAIINHFHSKNATEMARLIRSVCTMAIKSEIADYEDITCLSQFSEYVQELANEHFHTAEEFYYQHKKSI